MSQRMKRPVWLSFTEARALIHDECISSIVEYLRWHEWNKPRQIPKYPCNVYKEWVSWNDFLNNDNVFDKKRRKIRPMLEAIAWVHSLRLKSAQAWVAYVREEGIPNDIPSHPELYYDTWVSWSHWLGNTLSTRVATAQQIVQEVGILYIVHVPGRPTNVFKIGVEAGGASALREAQLKIGFRVVRMFKMEVGYDWRSMVLQHAKPWWEDESEYVAVNVHQLIFDLGSDLLFA